MNTKQVNLRRLTNQHNRLMTSEVNGENTGSVSKSMRASFVKSKGDEVVKNLEKPLVNIVIDFLETQFAGNWNIETKDKVGGAKRIHINSKNAINNQAEVVVILSSKGKITINMTPVDRIEEGYFIAETINFKRLSREIENIKEYFATGVLPEDSKLERVGFFDEWDGIETNNFDGTKIATKFGKFSQEEYERIQKSEGDAAAQKYSQDSVK